ncbi:MAG: plasmid pRiA4b ORF-3 family protein [Eubacteriaceae bacterium]|nr:plasmid pRiA4b ORF-3 family protein [Eubacteriaceae bacterium]
MNPQESGIKHPLDSWHAGLLKAKGKLGVVFINDITRYAVVVFELKEPYMHITSLFRLALLDYLADEGIDPEIANTYISESGFFHYSISSDTKALARLTRMTKDIKSFLEQSSAPISNRIVRIAARNKNATNFPFQDGEPGSAGYREYRSKPCKKMVEALRAYGSNPIKCHAVELAIRLDSFRAEIWREVTVPMHFTFSELHEVISAAFGWSGTKVHEFYIMRGINITASIVPSKYYSPKAKAANQFYNKHVLVKDVLPTREIIYQYSTKEECTHFIKVRSVIVNYSENNAICTAGKGNIADLGLDHNAQPSSEGAYSQYEDGVNLDLINSQLKLVRS